jgi:hypothetical protein
MSWSGSCNACNRSVQPATSLIHFSLRGCQIIFFINRIFDVHISTFHYCRLYYLILVEKIKRVRWCVCRWLLSDSHALCILSTGSFVTYQSFSRYQLESLRRILDDAVEYINLSPRRSGIRLPTKDDIDCVVPVKVSVSKVYKVCNISIWKQRWQAYSNQLPKAPLLHNKPASTGISPGDFCAQGRDKRYTNLLPL